jgi:1-acyl-sn-glycerol-3-phosphate acyltransferase
MIVAPHTSNWDFLIGVMAMFALGVRVTFLGKHTLFRWPLGGVMRWIGGIGVDRRSSSGVVAQSIELLQGRDQLILVVAPEGTRGQVDQWKTGFYHIAAGAEVPILPVSFGYRRKLIRFGEMFIPTGNVEADLQELRDFYSDVSGKRGSI